MKSIINGKKYDTDTAQEIVSHDNGLGSGDFRSLSETLYLKKTGEYFLYGEGGAMTRYARSCGNMSFGGGKKIIPITLDEAKEFVESYCSSDRYEELFGAIGE